MSVGVGGFESIFWRFLRELGSVGYVVVEGSATGARARAGDGDAFVAASALISVWYSVCASATAWSAHTAAADGRRQAAGRDINNRDNAASARASRGALLALLGEERTQQQRRDALTAS